MPWYIYTLINGDICDVNNYTLYGPTAPLCGTPKLHLCAIQANDNMGRPILTSVIVCEIASALQNKTESTNVRLKP